ncbi:hypothetical protein [Phytohabitans rumicis]|uniref:Uncharacterized protein n=1 Tax=Phytohabitans rumicis TaxID=1076125 RepID=A0A6V8L1T4_9ACTN|nr:hypothetical protein [Phytohabitans rumicis]GFJ88067.1 hypothetical protein Prum_017090 [Phytohabitans rumicis]
MGPRTWGRVGDEGGVVGAVGSQESGSVAPARWVSAVGDTTSTWTHTGPAACATLDGTARAPLPAAVNSVLDVPLEPSVQVTR